MEFKTKKREWVKNAAIIFLAVLLVLTFFSNTIMNRTLAEVATAQVNSGTITAKVRGNGKVTANGNHEVKATQTRVIRTVMVKAGQEVNAGDVLFVLGEGDSKELEAAKDELRELQLSYQRSAISMPTVDYTSQNNAIKSALRNATDAENTMNSAEAKWKATIVEDGSDSSEIEKEKERINSSIKACDDEIAALQAAAADGTAKITDTVSVSVTINGAPRTFSGERGSVYEQLVRELKWLEESGKTEPPAVTETPAPTEPPTPTETPTPTVPPTTTDNPADMALPTPAPVETVSPTPEPTPAPTVAPAETTPAAEATPAAAAEGGIELLSSVTTTFSSNPEAAALEREILALEKELPAADGTLYSNSAAYNQAMSRKIADIQAQREAFKLQLLEFEDDVNKYKGNPTYRAEYEAARRAYEDSLAALENAYAALSVSQAADNKSIALAALELQNISDKISRKQEEIKSLAGDAENQVLANVSGTVTSIACTAGDTVAADSLLCTIEVGDMGYTLSFTVSSEQAQRLRVGDSASISNYYWGKEIVATLTSIRNDPKNPQSSKLLTFDLEGDVSSGSELTISVGSKSANYDLIVPNSSIRSDTNGSFVLAVQAKNSPLGNRYTAKRVSVEVIASDDENSAVTGGLSSGDFVITTSNSPVANGDMVRMADNVS